MPRSHLIFEMTLWVTRLSPHYTDREKRLRESLHLAPDLAACKHGEGAAFGPSLPWLQKYCQKFKWGFQNHPEVKGGRVSLGVGKGVVGDRRKIHWNPLLQGCLAEGHPRPHSEPNAWVLHSHEERGASLDFTQRCNVGWQRPPFPLIQHPRTAKPGGNEQGHHTGEGRKNSTVIDTHLP